MMAKTIASFLRSKSFMAAKPLFHSPKGLRQKLRGCGGGAHHGEVTFFAFRLFYLPQQKDDPAVLIKGDPGGKKNGAALLLRNKKTAALGASH